MENGLTPRQWALKRYLEQHFISGKFYTIEELVAYVVDANGNPYYKLNTNPYTHDKCVALGSDIKTINWSCNEGYKIIVKDSKGSAKLCESEEEFEEWRENELKPVVRKFQYLNNLKWKAQRDGIVPIINQANNPIEEKDLKPIEVYKKVDDPRVQEDKPIQLDIWGFEML